MPSTSIILPKIRALILKAMLSAIFRPVETRYTVAENDLVVE